MFCENCGTKNENNANFCEKCGAKMNKKVPKNKDENKKNPQLLANLPKNTKIAMGLVVLIVIVAIIILSFLLKNPVKKVEDYLISYYDNYSYGISDNKELIEIGKILKSSKSDEHTLQSIKNTTHNAIKRWVKNFNTEYKDSDSLNDAYKKVSNALKDIYNYFDGLEYMLDRNLYTDYSKELNTLYTSKKAYLQGKSYEEKNDNYSAYYNYQKVDESDIYYYQASEFISNFVKDEIDALKEKTRSMLTITNGSQKKDQVQEYLKILKYLNENKKNNNIDLSTTEEYKELYEEYANQVLRIIRELVNDYSKEENYEESLKLIDEGLTTMLNKESETYQELEKLKESTKDKMPTSLLMLSSKSYQGVSFSNYQKTINNQNYATNISFVFNKTSAYTVYNLEGKYKRFKTNIVKDVDYTDELFGYFVIYADDIEVYKSEIITKNSELNPEIDIDVTNVKNLKIEFVTTTKGSGYNYYYIYLVEPYLYK